MNERNTDSSMPRSNPHIRSPDYEICLSIVVPVYGAPLSLQPLSERIKAVCASLNKSYELILVDDRCPKDSWQAICDLSKTDETIVGLRLSKNFGQHAAIQAGLSRARGEWIVVMDCDLQDRPEEFPGLINKALEGYDIVRAVRNNRYDPKYRQAFSQAFYSVLSYLTDTHQSAGFSNFGVYHRKVIDAITTWNEEFKYFPAIVSWVGFSQATLEVRHDPRLEGSSSYTLYKLARLALNVIVGFSDKPLKIVMVAGLAIAVLAFGVAFLVMIMHLSGAITVQGWAGIILSLWFIGGSLLFALGLTGLYVGRVLVEVKGRPNFIVDRSVAGEARSNHLSKTPSSDAAGAEQ